jgi:hypothetical protein
VFNAPGKQGGQGAYVRVAVSGRRILKGRVYRHQVGVVRLSHHKQREQNGAGSQ